MSRPSVRFKRITRRDVSHRMLYEIHEGKLLVLVVAVGHRSEIYR